MFFHSFIFQNFCIDDILYLLFLIDHIMHIAFTLEPIQIPDTQKYFNKLYLGSWSELSFEHNEIWGQLHLGVQMDGGQHWFLGQMF